MSDSTALACSLPQGTASQPLPNRDAVEVCCWWCSEKLSYNLGKTHQVPPDAPVIFQWLCFFLQKGDENKIGRLEAESLLIFNPFFFFFIVQEVQGVFLMSWHSSPGNGENWRVRPGWHQVIWIKHTLKKTSLVNISFSSVKCLDLY